MIITLMLIAWAVLGAALFFLLSSRGHLDLASDPVIGVTIALCGPFMWVFTAAVYFLHRSNSPKD